MPYLSRVSGNVCLHGCLVAASLPSMANPGSAGKPSSQGLHLLPEDEQFQARSTTSLSFWPVLHGKAKQICTLSLWVQNCEARTSQMAPEMHNFNSTGHTAQLLAPPCPLHVNPLSQPQAAAQKSLKSSPTGTVCTQTAHHCLSSPASGPFYSTINTGWRRNR